MKPFLRYFAPIFSLILMMAVVAIPSVEAQTFTVLSNFTGSSGAYPYGGLMQDSAGNLYGTTHWGGAFSAGTIFAVLYGAEPVLHSFSGSDGSIPKGGLIRDQNGVVYATTEEGGTSGLGTDSKGNLYGVTYHSGSFGQGTVFKVKGKTFTLLRSFNCASDGCYPVGALIEDKSGNLYGTGNVGGPLGSGTVWKLIP